MHWFLPCLVGNTQQKDRQQATKNKVAATGIWPYIAQRFIGLLQTAYLNLQKRYFRLRNTSFYKSRARSVTEPDRYIAWWSLRNIETQLARGAFKKTNSGLGAWGKTQLHVAVCTPWSDKWRVTDETSISRDRGCTTYGPWQILKILFQTVHRKTQLKTELFSNSHWEHILKTPTSPRIQAYYRKEILTDTFLVNLAKRLRKAKMVSFTGTFSSSFSMIHNLKRN